MGMQMEEGIIQWKIIHNKRAGRTQGRIVLLQWRTLLKQFCTSSISTNQCVSVRWPVGRLKTLICTDKQGGKKSSRHVCAWVRMCVFNEPDSLEAPFRLTVMVIHISIGLKGNQDSRGSTKRLNQGDNTKTHPNTHTNIMEVHIIAHVHCRPDGIF